jgi:chitinase
MRVFRYALAALSFLVLGGATASAEVLADEPVTISVKATKGGAEPGTAAVFTLELSAPLDANVGVRLSTAPADGDDAATAGADFEAADNVVLQFPKGETAAKLEVRVVDDQLDEVRERFLVVLSDALGKGVRIDPALRTATGTIQDNDDPPAAKVANAPDVAEGNSGTAKALFAVSLSKRSGREVRVAFATKDGTAKAGEDYVARSGVLRLPAGALTGTVAVDVTGDTKVEGAETFSLAISKQDETAVLGSPTEATARILNDDTNAPTPPPPPPTPANLSIADVSADEAGTAAFRVTLAPAVNRAVTVKWATADGTAAAGKDYTAGSGTLSFAANETAKTVAVALLADELAEGSETFTVALSSPVGATVADGQAVGTILDKGTQQSSSPSLSITDVLARESEGATFTLELTKAASSRVSVTVSTSDGSAREGLDYLARRTTIEFAPGERTKSIEVTVIDDELAEPNETFSVDLGNPVNATIAKGRGIAMIEINDQPASVVGRLEGIPPAALPVTPKPPAKTTKGKTAKVTKAVLPRMAIWPLTVRVGPTGIARMTTACKRASPVTCSGHIALEPAAKPRFRLGTKTFRVRPGKQASLPLKLGLRARTLLAREGRVRARVVVVVKAGAVYVRVYPGVITLVRSR